MKKEIDVDAEKKVAAEVKEPKKEKRFDLINLSVGFILGMLALTIVKEIGVDSFSILTGALLPIFFIFGIAYLWSLIRKKVKNGWVLLLIFIAIFLFLSLFYALIIGESNNKKFNPDNYSHITNNANTELLTKEQMLNKFNSMTDNEVKDYLISEISDVSSADLKIAMLKKIDNLTLPYAAKNELKNKFELMSGDDIKKQMIDEINSLSAKDARQKLIEKAESLD
ncbi:MAG: magnesium transporter [Patescibacteria group bacterium]|jgi:hypothetical protein